MHSEAIKSEQKKVFAKLSKFPQFYLCGGTGLALQIGHRVSIDFDLFSEKEIPSGLLSKIKRVFKDFNEIKVIVNHQGQLSVFINGIKIDFVKFKFPPALDLVKYEGVKILQPMEIAVMKAYTLNFRGTFRDYIDLYFLLKEEWTTLEKIKELSDIKYGDEFNFRLFLEQLIYLDDIETEEIEFLNSKVNKSEMKEFFKTRTKNLNLKYSP